jgi:nitrogen fixation NifU-like protein
MDALRELYQEVILDHHRKPRNRREMPEASAKASGHNPLCGDRFRLYLTIDAGVITDVGFQGSGCAISKASASMMTDCLKGCPVADACALFERFHSMVTTPPDVSVEDLGKLSALAGVREFPVRVKCASLAWHTFKAALKQAQRATTEAAG